MIIRDKHKFIVNCLIPENMPLFYSMFTQLLGSQNKIGITESSFKNFVEINELKLM